MGNSRRFFLKGSHVFKFFGLDIVARLLMNQGLPSHHRHCWSNQCFFYKRLFSKWLWYRLLACTLHYKRAGEAINLIYNDGDGDLGEAQLFLPIFLCSWLIKQHQIVHLCNPYETEFSIKCDIRTCTFILILLNVACYRNQCLTCFTCASALAAAQSSASKSQYQISNS